MLVALILLTVAVVALTALAAYMWRQLLVAQRQTEKANMLVASANAMVEAKAKESVARSRTAHIARISEQIAPLLPGFAYNLKDVQWVGGTVDALVWNGLESGGEVEVVFLDVKTGNARLNERQRRIREAVEQGRVRFDVFKPKAGAGAGGVS